MLKRYKNYSKRVKTDHWSQASSASALSPRTAARASFASDEGLWVLRVRLDLGTRRVDCAGTGAQYHALTFR